MHKAINILKVVAGDNHPDISSISLNLGLMYQDVENFHAAIDCFTDSLYRNIALYGEDHIQVASSNQAIAHAYYLLHDFRMALDYQVKSHLIIKKLMPEDSQYVIQSQKQLNQFMALSVQVEKNKQFEKGGQREIGQNKPRLTEQQKEEIQKRQRIEQYLKRISAQQEGGQQPQYQNRYRPGQGSKAGFLELLEQRYRS